MRPLDRLERGIHREAHAAQSYAPTLRTPSPSPSLPAHRLFGEVLKLRLEVGRHIEAAALVGAALRRVRCSGNGSVQTSNDSPSPWQAAACTTSTRSLRPPVSLSRTPPTLLPADLLRLVFLGLFDWFLIAHAEQLVLVGNLRGDVALAHALAHSDARLCRARRAALVCLLRAKRRAERWRGGRVVKHVSERMSELRKATKYRR